MTSRSDLREKIAEIARAYKAELPTKAAELKKLWRAVQAEQWCADRLGELHRSAHSLAGSGATFGFADLSSRARALETELKALLHQTATEVDATRARVPALFNALIAALQTAGAEPALAAGEEESGEDGAGSMTQAQRLIHLLGGTSIEVDELIEQLGYYGYRVERFKQTSALVEALRTAQPAGVLIAQDPTPELFAALQPSVRGDEGAARIPLIVVADRFDLDIRLAAVRSGCDGYFTWPVDAGVIAGRLQQLTDTEVAEPYRVLIVEDDTALAHYFGTVLDQAGFVARTVNNPLEVMQVLGEFNPELILMDLYMPDCSGVELAAVIRQEDAYVGIPIVYLSAETDLAKQVDAMQRGGDEFLTKPIDPNQLVAAVRYRVRRSRTLSTFLRRDCLTGLLNHTSMKEALGNEVERSRRRGSQFTFAMIDIDRFKTVNDTYGHPAGDRVIKSLARLLKQRLRKTDVIARYGGEEFAVILPDTPLERAIPVLDELRKSFENIRQTSGDAEFSVTFSCGAATYPAHEVAEEILFRADEALYKAKHQGRNRVMTAG